ncbi:hypothetical protein [Novosphingobium olei]|uniref:WYL domain-containing protein n=1 Tax=Novosphingobium olei TaxID=2728851 RepID=UPI003089BB6A|nr:TerB family tellurite resistance protein [Novosphingobium olei]
MLSGKWRELIGRFGRNGVVPPVPDGLIVIIDKADAETEEIAEAPPINEFAGAPLGLFIVYRDSSGKVSQRRITCKRFEPERGNLHAVCHERKALRCFKLSRIEECVIASTGEVVEAASIISYLPEGGPIRDRRLAQILTLLVFIMKCDGRAHPSERDEIESAAGSYALRFDRDEAIVAQAVRTAAMLAPDFEDAVAALRFMEQDEAGARLARLVRPFVDRVIAADGVVASQEAYFGGVIGDALAEIAEGRPAF